ncbi:MAG: hypothetical protein QGH94_13545 [Phycisphaerae bacterium]|jgi:hypothetical protein|nr:hypothetical protein [Phycisphaerae bacterium]MDP7289004.1 hypothetical protein [Phycisphaerae bacterium]
MKSIVMRWRQSVVGGVRNWHLAALHPDGEYWGYVHIRTADLRENRGFQGRVSSSLVNEIHELIERIDPGDAESDEDSADGLIGLGSRSEMEVVLSYRADLAADSNSDLFLRIVGMLQPHVSACPCA